MHREDLVARMSSNNKMVGMHFLSSLHNKTIATCERLQGLYSEILNQMDSIRTNNEFSSFAVHLQQDEKLEFLLKRQQETTRALVLEFKQHVESLKVLFESACVKYEQEFLVELRKQFPLNYESWLGRDEIQEILQQQTTAIVHGKQEICVLCSVNVANAMISYAASERRTALRDSVDLCSCTKVSACVSCLLQNYFYSSSQPAQCPLCRGRYETKHILKVRYKE